ncbi:C40 family peptidase [Ruminiclostridium herbifermentans]|uniref:C40 family peptidase n=1 Tax=Ruminiclostridium herbifermentans TaxID=2488810 RepID=A0A4U7JKS1_9FIRM|nr:C40 family peptidase [Ruminiclostridium herbifermentans]QNU68672.1 C40 family peptidase [Ruminiclostridium herbifermentans]
MKKIIAAALVAVFVTISASSANAEYYVKKGDTMAKIAKQFNMSLADLISLNPHIENPNKIDVNDYIIVRTKDQKKRDLVDYARSLQSVTAYKYGGNNPPYSTDCSGWTQHIYKKFGVNLPRVSSEQARTGQPMTFKQLQLGDLMFFSTRADKVITHVGIYIGNDLWISNLNEEKDVQILSTWGTWCQKYFLWGARHNL